MRIEKEEWKKVEGFENYEINRFGIVRKQYAHQIKGFKIIKSQKGKYLTISLRKNGIQKNCFVHRLIAKAFIPNPFGKPFINHIDGNKYNNSISNLEWVTNSENILHSMYIIKTNPKKIGINHHKSKSFSIKYQDGSIVKYESGGEFQRITGIHHTLISKIRSRNLHPNGYYFSRKDSPLLGCTLFW